MDVKELNRLKGEWIRAEKGSMPEDLVPEKCWKGTPDRPVQSFRVRYSSGPVEGFGIRVKKHDGTWSWDNGSRLYSHWKLREDMPE